MHIKSCIILLILSIAAGSCRIKKDAPASRSLTEREQIAFSQLFFDASKEKMLGNIQNATELFFKCLEIDKNSSATMYQLAVIFDSKNQPVQAIRLMEKALSIEPKNTWYSTFLAELYEKTGHFNLAIKIHKDLVKDNPERGDFYFNLANSYLMAGKYEDAVKVYNKIEEQTGISEEVSLQKENIFIRLNDFNNAVKELQKLIEAFPAETKYYGMLAELYQSNGKDEKAMEMYNHILQVEPDNPFIHLSLAEYYQSKGEKEKSFSHLIKAFENPDLDIDNKIKIMLSFYNLSEKNTELKAQAYQLLDILVKAHPKDAKANSIYGDFLIRDRRLKEARDQFRLAATLEKSRFPIWNQLLSIEAELNDYTALETESKEAIELFPTQPIVFLMNGLANIHLAKYPQAIESLQAGLAITVDDPLLKMQFHSTLGDAYFKSKNYKESDKHFEKALKIDRNNTYVLNNYSYYLSLRGDSLDKAAEMSLLANQLEQNSPSFLDTYGWILYQQKKYPEAKEWLEKALNAGGNSGAIFEHYGDVLYRLSEPGKAMDYWKKAKAAGGASEAIDKKISDGKIYEP